MCAALGDLGPRRAAAGGTSGRAARPPASRTTNRLRQNASPAFRSFPQTSGPPGGKQEREAAPARHRQEGGAGRKRPPRESHRQRDTVTHHPAASSAAPIRSPIACPAPAPPLSALRERGAGPAPSVTARQAGPAGRGRDECALPLAGSHQEASVVGWRSCRSQRAGGGGEVPGRVAAGRRSLGAGAQHGRGCGARGTCGLVALAQAGARRPRGDG